MGKKGKKINNIINFEKPNPNIDFAHSPFYVNTELKPWDVPDGLVRRAGVSAFGFGGTNFHAVLEEYIPGRLKPNGNRTFAAADSEPTTGSERGRSCRVSGWAWSSSPWVSSSRSRSAGTGRLCGSCPSKNQAPGGNRSGPVSQGSTSTRRPPISSNHPLAP